MAIRLRTKMAITHGVVALITVFLVVVASYLIINERFLGYVAAKHFEDHKKVVESFEATYQGGWDTKKLGDLGIEVLHKGYLITVLDNSGNTLWEPKKEKYESYHRTMQEKEKEVLLHFGTPARGVQTKIYELKSGNQNIGKLLVRFYGSYFLTVHDLMFLKYLHNSLFWVAGLAFLLSLILSNLISNKMSGQIGRIIQSAKDMARGKDFQKETVKGNHVVEIRELAQALEYLEESLKEKEASNKRLTADIAHELRTPLSTLQSHLEAMLEGVWQPTYERLVSCHEEIVRMTGLVQDLEKLNKYDTGRIDLKMLEFDMDELVRNIYTNFQGDFYKKNIGFNYSGESCTVMADREKLGQVMVNLISNSLKYTPEKGMVFVNVAADKNHVYIVINDNGVGMSQEDLPKIFNRLYRADTSRARATGGAGIGLAIAKAIVEAHHGQIQVVSQQGKGTEFTVIIPRNQN
ncbi:MAG: sensor histidine kinase [Thermincolia bacterium]